jgi:hypothetical protein
MRAAPACTEIVVSDSGIINRPTSDSSDFGNTRLPPPSPPPQAGKGIDRTRKRGGESTARQAAQIPNLIDLFLFHRHPVAST